MSSDFCLPIFFFPILPILSKGTLRALEDDSGERTWQYRGNSSEAPIVVAARKAGLPEDITAQQLGDVNPLGESGS